MLPTTSPNPIVVPRMPGALAGIVTVSPSSRNDRVLPSASSNGSAPFQLSSSATRCCRSGPETVPEANRSPVRNEAPFDVIWAIICAGVQYMSRNRGRDTTASFTWISSARSRLHACSRCVRYGGGGGSWTRGRHHRQRSGRPGEQPTARSSWRSSCQGTDPAARTPRPGCRARSSRSGGRRRTRGRVHHRLEPAPPAGWRTDHEADLGLDVESARRTVRRRRILVRPTLTAWAGHGCR